MTSTVYDILKVLAQVLQFFFYILQESFLPVDPKASMNKASMKKKKCSKLLWPPHLNYLSMLAQLPTKLN